MVGLYYFNRRDHESDLPTNPPSTSQEITLAQVGNNHCSFDLLNHRNFDDGCFHNPSTGSMTAQQKTILQCFLMILANAKSKAHAEMVKQQIKHFEKSCKPKRKTMPNWVDKF